MDKQDKIFQIADTITRYNFDEIWNREGQTMVTLGKKDVAEEMFFKGIAYILDHLTSLEQIDLEKVKQELEKNL